MDKFGRLLMRPIEVDKETGKIKLLDFVNLKDTANHGSRWLHAENCSYEGVGMCDNQACIAMNATQCLNHNLDKHKVKLTKEDYRAVMYQTNHMLLHTVNESRLLKFDPC